MFANTIVNVILATILIGTAIVVSTGVVLLTKVVRGITGIIGRVFN